MQIAMVGLGRMGANMVRRLMRGGHECVVFDRRPASVDHLASEGALGVGLLEDLATSLAPPRAVWVMVPAGEPTEEVVRALAGCLAPEDIIIDGGNSYFKDDIRRGNHLRKQGISYVDVGTSGGLWGVDRGYCLMIGGAAAAVRRLDPIFRTLAPGRGQIERTPGRETSQGTAEEGYIHCGPCGAGHFVKMVHNGIEYGLMQAYAEGFDILRRAGQSALPDEIRYNFDLADVAEVWRRGERRLVVAPGLDGHGAARGRGARELFWGRARFRRGTLDHPDGHRGSRAGGRTLRGVVRAVPLATGSHVRREGPVSDATQVRRTRGATGRGVTLCRPRCPAPPSR